MNQPGLFDPPEPCLLDRPLALLDLETTGTSAERDRIIEIGLVLSEPQAEPREWSTLVHPGRPVNSFIADYTGISNAMLADAPTFAEVATELAGMLAGRLLVAHNARFDYGFLQREFARYGTTFETQVLCTVRLSRKLFPRQRRHSLDAIMTRHGLACTARHRALGDALVLADFLRLLRTSVPRTDLNRAITSQLGKG